MLILHSPKSPRQRVITQVSVLSVLLFTSVTFFGVSPATAQIPESPTVEAPLYTEADLQTLEVSPTTQNPVIERDVISATTPEELAAIRAAEAEAQAQAASAAAAEAITASRAAGVASGQVIPAGSIIAAAETWVGVVPYGSGNNPSDSFSCDGYVQYVFAQNGISLPRGADAQGNMGTIISQSEAQAGDLVWWPGQHIGIYDGAGGMYDSPMEGRYVQHRVGSLWGNPVFVRL